MAFGAVSDSDGDDSFYFTFSGNMGVGGGYGYNTGVITPRTERNFQIEDWPGTSNSYSLGAEIGPVGATYTSGGTEADGSIDNKTGFLDMGKTEKGYTTTSISSSKVPGVKVEAMISKSKTWLLW